MVTPYKERYQNLWKEARISYGVGVIRVDSTKMMALWSFNASILARSVSQQFERRICHAEKETIGNASVSVLEVARLSNKTTL